MPCSSCRKAKRTDCKLHRRRERASRRHEAYRIPNGTTNSLAPPVDPVVSAGPSDTTSAQNKGPPDPRPKNTVEAYRLSDDPIKDRGLPEKDNVDELINAYFENINSRFPLIGQNLFRAQHDIQDLDDPLYTLILSSIVAIGACTKHKQRASKSQIYRRAKMLLDSCAERADGATV